MRVPLIVLVAGAATLSAILIGMRMLAPFYGFGPFLSSALIAVALLALALGFVLGGRPARRDPHRGISAGLLGAGVWMLSLPWFGRPLLRLLEPLGLRAAVVIAAIVILAPMLVPLGSILPNAARLAAERTSDAGRAVGALLAAWMLGAVVAAPLLAFVLLPFVGVGRSGVVIGLLQVFAALGARRPPLPAAVVVALGLSMVADAALMWWAPGVTSAGVLATRTHADRETRVVLKEGSRYLLEDGTIHTVVEPVTGAPLHRVPAALGVCRLLIPAPGRMLIAGLRGGAAARTFAKEGWEVDVVDPEPDSAIASRYFGLRPTDARVIMADPRAYLRRTAQSYDLIVLDTFADSFVPLHLVTREFFAETKRHLFQGGVLAVVMETRGWDDVLVRSVAATLRTQFQSVLALPTSEPPNALGSIILIAGNRPLEIPEERLPDPYQFLPDPALHWTVLQEVHAWGNQFDPEPRGVPVLTDDRNPASLWGERINLASRRELHRFFGPRGGSW